MVAHRRGGRLSWVHEKVAVPNVVRHAPVLNRTHPNEKPVELVRTFIRLTAAKSNWYLTRHGSGSTGIACMRFGRRFLGIEIEPRWLTWPSAAAEAELARYPLLPDEKPAVQGEMFAE